MSSFSLSSVPLAKAVDKATSKLLLTPDWTMNIQICDFIDSHPWETMDAVKAVKKRLQHKDAKVQILALTLLESMVKNCGEHVHLQIADKHILQEMVKIVKKKRSGVKFPQSSRDVTPMFTPPATGPNLRQSTSSGGMSNGSFRRLDETMATEIESLSLSSLESMRDVMDLLNDMVQAVNPADRSAVKNEVIVDLVDRCRSNQKKLIQMLTTTGDEEILARGLELNDMMQIVLARHDALASSTPLVSEATGSKPTDSGLNPTKVKDPSPEPNSGALIVLETLKSDIHEKEEIEDDFAQLARRHSKTHAIPSEAYCTKKNGSPVPTDNGASHSRSVSKTTQCKELALKDPSKPVRTTSKEHGIIDLLSITLSTALTTPAASDQTNIHRTAASLGTNVHPHAPRYDPETTEQILQNSYVVPWAQPKRSQPQLYAQVQSEAESWGQSHLPNHMPTQPHHSSFSHGYYPPTPWAATMRNISSTNDNSCNSAWSSASSSNIQVQAVRQLQHYNSFSLRGSNGGSAVTAGATAKAASLGGQKPFTPYLQIVRRFECLLERRWGREGHK